HEARGVGAACGVAWGFGGVLHTFLLTKNYGPRQATPSLDERSGKGIQKMSRSMTLVSWPKLYKP
ncbi:MAG: hypothetical protein AAF399_29050, partial [Bacteroidota bacterium]